jgi:hypothetical protein
VIEVLGADAARVGHLAHRAGVELHELATSEEDLERTFLRLVTAADPDRQVEPRPEARR